MLMEIVIDHDKCRVPVNCRKCLQICPMCVFKLHPTNIRRFEEIPLENWELHVSFPDLCSGCMECVDVCPERAIRIRVRKDRPAGRESGVPEKKQKSGTVA